MIWLTHVFSRNRRPPWAPARFKGVFCKTDFIDLVICVYRYSYIQLHLIQIVSFSHYSHFLTTNQSYTQNLFLTFVQWNNAFLIYTFEMREVKTRLRSKVDCFQTFQSFTWVQRELQSPVKNVRRDKDNIRTTFKTLWIYCNFWII